MEGKENGDRLPTIFGLKIALTSIGITTTNWRSLLTTILGGTKSEPIVSRSMCCDVSHLVRAMSSRYELSVFSSRSIAAQQRTVAHMHSLYTYTCTVRC